MKQILIPVILSFLVHFVLISVDFGWTKPKPIKRPEKKSITVTMSYKQPVKEEIPAQKVAPIAPPLKQQIKSVPIPKPIIKPAKIKKVVEPPKPPVPKPEKPKVIPPLVKKKDVALIKKQIKPIVPKEEPPPLPKPVEKKPEPPAPEPEPPELIEPVELVEERPPPVLHDDVVPNSQAPEPERKASPPQENVAILEEPSLDATESDTIEPVALEKEIAEPVVPEEAVPDVPDIQEVEASLLYPKNPTPKYPRVAQRRGQQGTVILNVRVEINGRVSDLRILTSSGFKILDRAALAFVQKWIFEPAMKGDKKVPMWVKVPVRFELK
jgi:periplasmic protein TonB